MLAANLNKFNRLSREERRLFVQAILLLPVIHLGLIVLGYSRLRKGLERLTPLKPIRSEPEPETLGRGQMIARLVAVAAGHGFYKASCLRKSLLVWWLLRRAGIPGKVCFGVRLVAQKLEAHAWVEYHGIVLNDSATVRQNFKTLHVSLPHTTFGL